MSKQIWNQNGHRNVNVSIHKLPTKNAYFLLNICSHICELFIVRIIYVLQDISTLAELCIAAQEFLFEPGSTLLQFS